MNRQPYSGQNKKQNPQKRDMYAAYRTGNRPQTQRPEQLNTDRIQQPPSPEMQNVRYHGSVYDLSGYQTIRQNPKKQPQGQAINRSRPEQKRQTGETPVGQNRQAQTAPQMPKNPPPKSAQTQTRTPSAAYTVRRQTVIRNPKNNPVYRQTPQAAQAQTASQENTGISPQTSAASSGKKAAKPTVYGERLAGENNHAYGHHSSYRTADGRIIDGFDKKGRPVYRPAPPEEQDAKNKNGAVIRHGAAVSANVRRLHPVQRIRIETRRDTDIKPFPLRTILFFFLCTAMAMSVLYSYMRLNEYTTTLSSLENTQTQLRNQAATLAGEVSRREDLISLENIATETLGMVKNDVLTKIYVSIENEDKTEVIRPEEEAVSSVTRVEIDLTTGKIKSEKELES